jgi:hypothetical protein
MCRGGIDEMKRWDGMGIKVHGKLRELEGSIAGVVVG